MSKKQDKALQIELQNLIFGTNEKKLMVSPEFLDQMTAQYISKRMKAVNQAMEVLLNTKNVKSFFTCYDTVMSNLDELIALQKYHEFKKPIPSEFRTIVDSKKDKYTLAMINRVWKAANMKASFDPTTGEKRSETAFGPVLNEILAYRDQYAPATLDHIDRFYKSVYGKSLFETDEPETPEGEEAAEAAGETSEEAPGEGGADEAAEESGEISAAEAADMKLNE